MNSWQRWSARSEAIAAELTSHSTVDTRDDGTPVIRIEEHYLARMADHLSREIRSNLDKLGLLSPDDADSGRTVVEVFAQAREEHGVKDVEAET